MRNSKVEFSRDLSIFPFFQSIFRTISVIFHIKNIRKLKKADEKKYISSVILFWLKKINYKVWEEFNLKKNIFQIFRISDKSQGSTGENLHFQLLKKNLKIWKKN